jgi:hypothetical protein
LCIECCRTAGSVQPVEEQQRRVAGPALLHRSRQQVARRRDVTGIVGVDPGVDEFLALALLLGEGTARPLDVRAGTAVAALEEDDAGPDVDRLLIAAGEILIEAGEEQLFDAGIAVRIGGRAACTGWERIGHQDRRDGGCRAGAIIRQNPVGVNELEAAGSGQPAAGSERRSKDTGEQRGDLGPFVSSESHCGQPAARCPL